MKELQLKLQAKERKLARYLKRGITNSNRSETTSPVESLNNSFKHGDRGVNSNFRLSRTLDTILDHTDGRIEEENRRCQRAMGMNNCASRASTKKLISTKSQALIDQNFDGRLEMKVSSLVQCSYFLSAW